jgi:hypothetical protein
MFCGKILHALQPQALHNCISILLHVAHRPHLLSLLRAEDMLALFFLSLPSMKEGHMTVTRLAERVVGGQFAPTFRR